MEEGKRRNREPFWEPVQESRKEICHCHLESSRAEEKVESVWAVGIGRTCWCIRYEREGLSGKTPGLRGWAPLPFPQIWKTMGRNSFEGESRVPFRTCSWSSPFRGGVEEQIPVKGAEIEGNSNKCETRKSKKQRRGLQEKDGGKLHKTLPSSLFLLWRKHCFGAYVSPPLSSDLTMTVSLLSWALSYHHTHCIQITYHSW